MGGDPGLGWEVTGIAQYEDLTMIDVYPFTRQPDGEEVVIGRQDTAVFLAIPPEGVEILDYLAQGKSIGEVRALLGAKYGETPDLTEFLELLTQKGFLAPRTGAAAPANPFQPSAESLRRYHFAGIPESVARRIFSRPMLLAAGILVALSVTAVIIAPEIVPGWRAVYFPENMTLMTLAVVAFSWVTIFLHEMAHLVATRAVGASARFGIGNRLWILVAETDMTGIWGVPRRQRYLPFLAGPLFDAVVVSLFLLPLFAGRSGWVSLSPMAVRLLSAGAFVTLMRLLWQCYFFLRTDLYYVLANYFGCKNLMGDTATFLRNQVARFMPKLQPVDQSHIPGTEMRVIRGYSLVWVAGRVVALGTLCFISIPLMWHYAVAIITTLGMGVWQDPAHFVDVVLIGTITLTIQITGLYLWVRNRRMLQR
jgi:putative peptide zinc metalloprotease protein